MLKMTTISMEEKPTAMAPLNSCSTMNPSMDKSNPRSGVTITASPMILMTTTMVAISTLPSVTMGPHSPGHTGTCIGPIGTMASVQTFTENHPGNGRYHLQDCHDLYDQKHPIYDYDNQQFGWFGYTY